MLLTPTLFNNMFDSNSIRRTLPSEQHLFFTSNSMVVMLLTQTLCNVIDRERMPMYAYTMFYSLLAN